MKKILALLFIITNSYAAVTFEQFSELKVALNSAFYILKPNEKHLLVINRPLPGQENFWWNLDQAHASYSQEQEHGMIIHNIFLFGGYARLKEMTLDGLALTACHELAHGIGGAPFKRSGSTQEGQADYYAAKTCLPIVFEFLNKTNKVLTSEIENICSQQKNINFSTCTRSLEAGKSLIYFFKTLGKITAYTTPTDEVAIFINNTNSFYPSEQCRIDTVLAGVLIKKRPRCWYPTKP